MRILKVVLFLFVVSNLIFTCNSSPSYSKSLKQKKTPIAEKVAEPSIISPDIMQALEMARKYRGNQSTEKSQLETQPQYEARINAAQSINFNMIEVTVSTNKGLYYNADKQSIFIRADVRPLSSIAFKDNKWNLYEVKNQDVVENSYKRELTCTNGYGARFNYLNTTQHLNNYGIAYIEKDNKQDGLNFELPMSVREVREYITSNESSLNDKLKFVIQLKPAFPFYKEDEYYYGGDCDGKSTMTSGETRTIFGKKYLALFDIASLKLVDSSTGTVLAEKDYTQKNSRKGTEFSNLELSNYYLAGMQMLPISQSASVEMKRANGGTLPRLLCRQPSSADGLNREVKSLFIKYCNQISNIMANHGMSFDRYSEIERAASSNPQLLYRIDALMQK